MMEVPSKEANKKLEVECPFCGTTLVIDVTGRLIETRKPDRKRLSLPWDVNSDIPDEGW